MSFEALAWAFKPQKLSSSQKFVLVGLANFANDRGEAYPSIETLSRVTNMNRKTVIRALDDLEKEGFLMDTGERKGKTQCVKVYVLQGIFVSEAFERTRTDLEQSQKRNHSDMKQSRFVPGSSPVLGQKQSQNRDSEPYKEPLVQEPKESVLPLTIPKKGKPTQEEVRTAGARIGLPEAEADAFFDYYSSNGWKVGRNPMASLPHAISRWKRTWEQRKTPHNGNGMPSWERIKALEGAIAQHSANQLYRGYDPTKVTQAMREDLKCLRAKLAELQKQQLQTI